MMLLLPLAVASAQPNPAPPAPRVGDAVAPIVIDGELSEPDWATAVPVVEFKKYLPVEGDAPPGRTEVRFLQDDRFLYVGVRVSGIDYRVRARVSARERINADDQIGIYLDTFHDGRSGYIFYFNALGIQQDVRHNAGAWNPNWDTAYRSRGQVTEDGYVIEVAFPWRSLKFLRSQGEEQSWGLIVTRKVPHEGAKYAWPDITRNRPLLFSEEGELTGVRPPARGSGLEVIPSLTASQFWSRDEPRPFTQLDTDPWFRALRPSLDVRFGLTPDLGLAATANPDFSQVESDLADVRLNARFAFQFTERRPFFLDGVDLFQDPMGTLYSRSVAEPVYGVKLSGREGPISIGVLNALDQSPLPSVAEDGTVGFTPEEVEDRWAENTLARLRLDAFGGGWLGVIGTDKRIVGSPQRAGGAGRHNNVGADLGVPIGARWLARAAAQSSFLDAPGEAARTGYMADASIARNGGLGVGFGVEGNVRTEAFRQEMGFLNQSGVASGGTWIDHTFETKGVVNTVTPGVWADWFQENDGDYFRSTGFYQGVLVNGIQSFNASARIDQRQQSGEIVNGWGVAADWSGQVGALLELAPRGSYNKMLDFGTLGPARTLSTGGRITLRTAGFRLDTEVDWTRHVPEGFDPELAHRVRTTLRWQWTRALGARLLVQESRRSQLEGVDQELLLSPLFTWLEVPGTAAYLGWTERIDLLAGETKERVIFAKASVLLRP